MNSDVPGRKRPFDNGPKAGDDLLRSVNPEPDFSPELVRARETLLDALDVLGKHRDALTLVGAQAVFEHTKQHREVPPTFTRDGDFGVDRGLLSDEPEIASVLHSVGFVNYRDRPGIWMRPDGTSVDLLVPETIAGPGRRSAHVDGQAKSAMGRAAGLELALLDSRVMTLSSFAASRTHSVKVAGPAALICAKSYKLRERLDDRARTGRDRVKSKDAGDVYRLLTVTDPHDIRAVFDSGEANTGLGAAIGKGREYFEALFSDGSAGVDLVALDLADAVPAERVRETLASWLGRFRRAG